MITTAFVAEALEALVLVDNCDITRPLAVVDQPIDPLTLARVDTPSAVFSGACLVAADDPKRSDRPGEQYNDHAVRVRLPLTATQPEPNDVITITASANNPAIVGLAFLVTGVRRHSLGVTKIVMCELLDRVD